MGISNSNSPSGPKQNLLKNQMAPELKKTVQNLRQIINEKSCTRGLIMNEGEQRKEIDRGNQEK